MVSRRRRSRLPRATQDALIAHFVAGSTARVTAALTGVHRNTATLFFRKLRETIYARLAEATPDLMEGEIEVDESYFGGYRRGIKGRDPRGKTAVFGLLKRGGRVHAVIVPNTARSTLYPIIRATVRPESVVYTDGYRIYDALDVSEFRHARVLHQETYVDGPNHINGIENFWNQAKRHLRRFNGIPRDQLPLFIKECEWRFNYRPTTRLRDTLSEWWYDGN